MNTKITAIENGNKYILLSDYVLLSRYLVYISDISIIKFYCETHLLLYISLNILSMQVWFL